MPDDASGLPAVGTRLIHSGHLGTVRFVGPVQSTKGIWLGVEWDDPQRGKHDGTKDGVRYFSCLVQNSGSFIRPTASGITYGTTFLKALVSKYVETFHGADSMEKVILGSSNGTIEVEAVNLDKIRGKLSRLESIREASVDNEAVSSGDEPGAINKTCPGIRGLDLSKNLFPSWDTVVTIARELPSLERIALNQNRLQLPHNLLEFEAAFSKLKELQLNSTLTTWGEATLLLRSMPSLQLLELGYNRIPLLEAGTQPDAQTNLHTLNLDGNDLVRWTDICSALEPYSGGDATYVSLQKLIVSGNHIASIEPPTDPFSSYSRSPLHGLKHLFLSHNSLKTWADINHIVLWCPALESLNITGNTLIEDPDTGKNARQLAIAKIPTLLALDAAPITPRERQDCELWYLSHIDKYGPEDEEARAREHPQWKALSSKYGKQDVPRVITQKPDTLSNRLIQLTISRYGQLPAHSSPGTTDGTLVLQALPSMNLRTLRMKLARSFKIPKAQQASMQLRLKMPDNSHLELDADDNTRDLSWWGLEDGSDLVLIT